MIKSRKKIRDRKKSVLKISASKEIVDEDNISETDSEEEKEIDLETKENILNDQFKS